MSYVGGPFAHDLFVTYSHGDVAGDDESPLKRWSQAFARELETELRAYPAIGRALSVFLDQDHRPRQGLDPMAPLTEQLRREIATSAIVTVLMSPQYLGSKWCIDERDWWHGGQQELQIPHEGRVALARIWPLPGDAKWPPLFVDSRGESLTGFWFFDRARAESRPQPFEWPAPTRDSKGPFREALLDLASSVRRALEEVKKRVEAQQRTKAEVTKLAGEGQLVYLHARSEQTRAWDATHDALTQNGFAVLPAEPEPVEREPLRAQALRERRVETLTGCDALLLLGSADGRAIDADLAVIGRQDRQSARALSNRLLPCALLDTVGDPIATPRRRVSAQALQVDWIDSTKEPWVPAVRSWLTQKSATLREAQ